MVFYDKKKNPWEIKIIHKISCISLENSSGWYWESKLRVSCFNIFSWEKIFHVSPIKISETVLGFAISKWEITKQTLLEKPHGIENNKGGLYFISRVFLWMALREKIKCLLLENCVLVSPKNFFNQIKLCSDLSYQSQKSQCNLKYFSSVSAKIKWWTVDSFASEEKLKVNTSMKHLKTLSINTKHKLMTVSLALAHTQNIVAF